MVAPMLDIDESQPECRATVFAVDESPPECRATVCYFPVSVPFWLCLVFFLAAEQVAFRLLFLTGGSNLAFNLVAVQVTFRFLFFLSVTSMASQFKPRSRLLSGFCYSLAAIT